ncbi:MAG: M14 family metallopeptidase [Rhodothermales bacterium]
MRNYITLLTLVLGLTSVAPAQAQLQSPENFLGYALGERFTFHHRVIDYFEHVAAESPQVVIEQYGETYEGRPLITAYIASPENMGRLEEIRINNLRRAGLESGEMTDASASIVWLGYNVHGNESVSMEASMKTLYALVDPSNADSKSWLENTVVIMDPCLNPDGRDRYANWYNQTVGRFPNALPEAREHREPWPGGRANHYLFDLNRDWAWMTQQELQARVPHYNKWMPQVHVDFHEQGVNSPYFFAPAAEPYHEAVSDWQREFQSMIGRNHAKYFDEASWLYFTRQVFDLLYPGYGDTWPTFNGAIGMTYEQAGSGRAGLGIITEEADTLTLADRIAHHHTTGLSTVEITAVNSERVLQEFSQFFQKAPEGPYGTYVIKGLSGSDVGAEFMRYLDVQGLRYGFASEASTASGFHYETGETRQFDIEEGDMVLNAQQPKSTLLRVLLDPKPVLSDSLAYDVTSWALPYVYGLDAYALEKAPARRRAAAAVKTQAQPVAQASITIAGAAKPYAYLVEWESFEDARFLAALFQKDIKLRYAEKPFEAGGHAYKAGTLIITRTGNEHMGSTFDAFVKETAATHNQPLHEATTGIVSKGADFGSGDVPFLKRPKVASLIGSPMSSLASGGIWHYFDQQLGFPVTLLNADGFDPDDLEGYDVLLLPSGSYSAVLSSNVLSDLRDWIRQGGRLVAFESATAFLAGKEGFNLEKKEESEAEEDSLLHAQRRYEDRERRGISDEIPGAIYRVNLDNSHPLAFGYPDVYFTMKRNTNIYAYLENDRDWNVGVIPEDGHLSGFVGANVKEDLKEGMVIGVQRMGQGDVVYFADNPLFRGFWYNGRLLVANTLFMK